MIEYHCARCGVSVGNGGIDLCSIVNDLEPEEGATIRIIRFCRDRVEGKKKIKGCTGKVLTPRNLEAMESGQ